MVAAAAPLQKLATRKKAWPLFLATRIACALLCVYLFFWFSLAHQIHGADFNPAHFLHLSSESITIEKKHEGKAQGKAPRNEARKDVEVELSKTSQQCQLLFKHLLSVNNKKCRRIEPQYIQPPHLTATPCIASSSKASTFSFDRDSAEAYLKKHGPESIRRVITAYMEPPLNDTIPGTGSRGNLDLKVEDVDDVGEPPQFKVPLPLRTHTPADLLKMEYPRVQTCHDLPAKFPVERGLELDAEGNPIVWNVGNGPLPENYPALQVPYCPVEADPFLPWIHDVFPSQDGTRIEFVAQNRRRCRTGKSYTPEINRLVPQATIMQPISVQRIDDATAHRLAPQLWRPASRTKSSSVHRYRLAPFEEASPDGMFTRFICRFHATDFSSGKPQTVVVGETLSEYPFNYEFISYRKGKRGTPLLTAKGRDTHSFWNNNLRFSCPLPADGTLSDLVATGASVLSDGTPTMFLDVIPIRTSARYTEIYLTPDMIGPNHSMPDFDPRTRWGEANVMPHIEASGRWANIPICTPPTFHDETCNDNILVPKIADRPQKPHFLSACLFSSAEFKGRGVKKGSNSETSDRIIEWIEFHLLVGFDHIYVYDNSGAHSNATSLEFVVDLFPGKVTRVDWPTIVCNNNVEADDSTGERSSQYAAENSCRTRHAPFTEWMAAFDTDEYLVPMGNYTSLKEVLRDAGDAKILTFRSSRGRLRLDKAEFVSDVAIEKRGNVTFLEAYNCDSGGIPKPEWADRARKQIYRADYVLNHFVHYSTVTRGLLRTYAEQSGKGWHRRYDESRSVERVTDEVHEAVMVHTKTIKRDTTAGFLNKCRYDYKKKWQGCWVAYPYPNGVKSSQNKFDENGMEYNCFANEKVDNYWIPKLQVGLQKRKRLRESMLQQAL